MYRITLKTVLIVLYLFAPIHNASGNSILLVSNGKLTGAQNVLVNGTLYDVEFIDGSCNSLFNNCDPTTFVFRDTSSAYAASQALVNQVFLDGAQGLFGTHPELTQGCSALSDCDILTPYLLNRNAVQTNLVNLRATLPNIALWGYPVTSSFDTSVQSPALFNPGLITYAVWSAQNSSIPSPSTLSIFIIGLLGNR